MNQLPELILVVKLQTKFLLTSIAGYVMTFKQ